MEAALPKVSVIIPTYNRQDFILEAINSVLSQDFLDFELIIVDDGSTDETSSRIATIQDPRLSYILQDNQGRSHARNRALEVARGQYIAFLDSDDAYLSDKLDIQVSYMDANPSVGMIYTSARCIDENGHELTERYIASVSGRIYRHIAFFRPVTITLPTVMIRRDLFAQVGGFDENMSRFEDTDMWRRLSKATDIYAMAAETCLLRTHSENSLSSQNPTVIMSSIDYYAGKIKREDTELSPWEARKGLGGLYLYYGRAFMTVPGWEDMGRKMLSVAFAYWPPYVFFHAVALTRSRFLSLVRFYYPELWKLAYICYRRIKSPWKR